MTISTLSRLLRSPRFLALMGVLFGFLWGPFFWTTSDLGLRDQGGDSLLGFLKGVTGIANTALTPLLALALSRFAAPVAMGLTTFGCVGLLALMSTGFGDLPVMVVTTGILRILLMPLCLGTTARIFSPGVGVAVTSLCWYGGNMVGKPVANWLSATQPTLGYGIAAALAVVSGWCFLRLPAADASTGAEAGAPACQTQAPYRFLGLALVAYLVGQMGFGVNQTFVYGLCEKAGIAREAVGIFEASGTVGEIAVCLAFLSPEGFRRLASPRLWAAVTRIGASHGVWVAQGVFALSLIVSGSFPRPEVIYPTKVLLEGPSFGLLEKLSETAYVTMLSPYPKASVVFAVVDALARLMAVAGQSLAVFGLPPEQIYAVTGVAVVSLTAALAPFSGAIGRFAVWLAGGSATRSTDVAPAIRVQRQRPKARLQRAADRQLSGYRRVNRHLRRDTVRSKH